jgi:hypothetical protein
MREERIWADGVAERERERSCNERSRRKGAGMVRAESEERRALFPRVEVSTRVEVSARVEVEAR